MKESTTKPFAQRLQTPNLCSKEMMKSSVMLQTRMI